MERWDGVRRLTAILGLAGLACAPTGTPVDPGSGRAPDHTERTSAARSALPPPGLPVFPPELRVGTSGDYAPFSRWPQGEPAPEGFSIDVARAFARAAGRRIEWVRFRWPELTSDLETGRFELALSGVTIRPDRSVAGRFSLPLTANGAVALVADSSTARSPADLDRPGIRIAVNRGGHLERVARSLFARAVLDSVPDNAAVPRRLAEGRADAVVTDNLEAPHWQAQLPPTRAIGPLTRDQKAAWFPIGSEALARDFDRWLLRFEAEGGLATLRTRHGLDDDRTAAPIPALLASLDERLALMPDVARAKAVLARPVEDAAQEQRVHIAVREATRRAAESLGIAPPDDTILRRVVDAQLRAARFVQERTLATNPSVPAPEPSAADREAARRALDTRLRPALGFITERIAWLLVAASPLESPTREAVSQALARHALPIALETEIHAAFAALFTPPLSPPESARTAAPTPRARSAPRDTAPSA